MAMQDASPAAPLHLDYAAHTYLSLTSSRALSDLSAALNAPDAPISARVLGQLGPGLLANTIVVQIGGEDDNGPASSEAAEAAKRFAAGIQGVREVEVLKPKQRAKRAMAGEL